MMSSDVQSSVAHTTGFIHVNAGIEFVLFTGVIIKWISRQRGVIINYITPCMMSATCNVKYIFTLVVRAAHIAQLTGKDNRCWILTYEVSSLDCKEFHFQKQQFIKLKVIFVS